MEQKAANLRRLFNLVGMGMLLIGLSSAVFIYLNAENDIDSPYGYVAEGGSVNTIIPEDSKKYLRDMELFGGKANVIADEFRRWCIGLWYGKSLAYTIGAITILLSSSVFYTANRSSD